MTRYNPTNPAYILSRSYSGTFAKSSNKYLSYLRERSSKSSQVKIFQTKRLAI